MLLVLLLVSGLSAVTGHKLDGAQFGSSSSYFTVANQDVTSLEVMTEEGSFSVRIDMSCKNSGL